jgi:RsiW-degrading membrane proteinase PrsW (M82 family)
MLAYLFGAVLVSWLVSIYLIRQGEVTQEGFWRIIASSMLTGLLWPVILFFVLVSIPAFLLSKATKS